MSRAKADELFPSDSSSSSSDEQEKKNTKKRSKSAPVSREIISTDTSDSDEEVQANAVKSKRSKAVAATSQTGAVPMPSTCFAAPASGSTAHYCQSGAEPTPSTSRSKKTTSAKGGAKSSVIPKAFRTKKSKLKIRPIPVEMRPTANDLFGTESGDDTVQCDGSQSGKKPLISYITRRVANGVARQVNNAKQGTHYVELKVYKCDEIERTAPVNRWRQAIITIKNRTDENTEAWKHLTDYVSATRGEFVNCPPTFISSNY